MIFLTFYFDKAEDFLKKSTFSFYQKSNFSLLHSKQVFPKNYWKTFNS